MMDLTNALLFNLPYTLILVLIITIGYLRHKIESITPKGLINIPDVNNKWLTENDWVARFSILFLPLIFIYNILVWFGFGITSIFEFTAFIFKKVWLVLVYLWSKFWALILFMWYEVIHPTVFWMLKLMWHYPLKFLWYFFEFAFQHIKYTFKTISISISVKKLLLLTSVSALFVVAYLIFPNVYSLIVFSILFLILLQYTVFSSIALHIKEFDAAKVKPSLTTILIWLAVSVSSVMILLIIEKLDVYPLSAAGVSISQLLLPIFVLLGIAFVSSVTCLAPFSSNKDSFSVIDYLRAILKRLPKLIYAQPFQLIGVAIVGIIPLLVIFTVNIGVERVTNHSFEGWISEISQLEYDLNDYKEVDNSILYNASKIDSLQKHKDSVIASVNTEISALETSKLGLIGLKNQIKDNQIHTFEGVTYEGEKQFFSIPSISQCTNYKFIIEKDDEIFLEKSISPKPNNQSIILNYRWWQAGQYKISLVPENSCGSLNIADIYVTVEASRGNIQAPTGKTLVCENEIVEYTTQDGFDRYEWQHPFGNKTTTTPNVILTWGNISGTIRVRGVNQNGETSLWTGTDVEVQLLPGSDSPQENFVANESANDYKVKRDFTFVSREAANDSIAKVDGVIASKTANLEVVTNQFATNIESLEKDLTALRARKGDIPLEMIGKFLAILGIALAIALLFATTFTYLILFHYHLFNFKQEGQHYWEETLEHIQSKNPKQPLLGVFVLLIVFAVAFALSLWPW